MAVKRAVMKVEKTAAQREVLTVALMAVMKVVSMAVMMGDATVAKKVAKKEEMWAVLKDDMTAAWMDRLTVEKRADWMAVMKEVSWAD